MRGIKAALGAAVFSLMARGAIAAEDLEQTLARSLGKVLPGVTITSVQPSGVPGLYEVAMGPRIVYMTADGRFLMTGDLMDLDGRRNLTDQRRTRARVDALAAVTGAIEFAPTNPKHVVHVFTDVDCGYCRRMHQEIAKINAAGIAVRYYAFPRAGLESESYEKAVAVWCAKDQHKALTDAKLGRPVAKARCENPVKAQFELGEALGVRGTPAVFTADGEEIGGYVPAAELAALLDRKPGS
jgi:thiol:disulfide interchange protein DsbC